MEIMAFVVAGALAASSLCVFLAAIRTLSSKSFPINLTVDRPMKARVMVECPVCRGGGREPLRVDPRLNPAPMDARLKPEDFPLCRECEGLGYKERYLLDLSKGSWTLTARASLVGSQFRDTSILDSERRGGSPAKGNSPSTDSKSEAA